MLRTRPPSPAPVRGRRARPRVAVVVPVYMSAPYLPLALGSLARQDERPLEVVVVDDGSPDESADVARSFAERIPGLRVVRQENRGVAGARNAGLRLTRAPYVCFLDGDDAVSRGMLAALADRLDDHAATDVAYAEIEEFETDADGAVRTLRRRRHGRGPAEDLLLHGHCPLLPSTSLVRRTAAEAVDGFRADFPVAEDYDFFVRLVLAGARFERVPGALGRYRRVAGQRSDQVHDQRVDMLRTLDHAFAALPAEDPRRTRLRERRRFLRLVHAGQLDRAGRTTAARRALLRSLPIPPRPGHLLEVLRLLPRPHRVLDRITAASRPSS